MRQIITREMELQSELAFTESKMRNEASEVLTLQQERIKRDLEDRIHKLSIVESTLEKANG